MQSTATSVSAYLDELPDDKRELFVALRQAILANLDGAYREVMQYGMIGYVVPHSVYPPGYHGDPRQPLPFAALGAQARHVGLYLMGLYCGCAPGGDGDDARWFRAAWAASGKKAPDMGKSCVRIKRLADVPLDVVGEAIRRMPAAHYIARYEQGLVMTRRRPTT